MAGNARERRHRSEWLDSANLRVIPGGSEDETRPNSAAFLFRNPEIFGPGIARIDCLRPIGVPTLCRYCDSIDLARLFNLSIDFGTVRRNGRFVAPLSSDPQCPLCCLFRSIVPPWWEGETVLMQCLPFLETTNHFLDFRHQDSMVLGPGLLLDYIWGTYKSPGNVQYLQEMQSCGMLAPVAPHPGQGTSLLRRVYGRAVQCASIDFELLKTWMSRCLSLHHHGQDLDGNFHPSWLIDCISRKLVRGSYEHDYIALSYVWGNASMDEVVDQVSGRILPDPMPLVVEDSMTVVLRMGYQYLWVDKYCVPQALDLQNEIRNMGRIYSKASFTIIAAAGQDAMHGLPGVSTTKRSRQPRADIKGRTIASTLTPLTTLLSFSKWQSRGWVFQEELFSPRKFYFTDQQVHFRCDSMHRCEAIDVTTIEDDTNGERKLPCHPHELKYGRRPLEKMPLSRDLISGDSHHHYWDFVKDYTRREMSFDTDSLAGLLGVLEAFSSLQEPLSHFWGIPTQAIYRDDHDSQAEHGFGPLSSLCWEHAKGYNHSTSSDSERSIGRRPGFPSWSWAGWRGEAQPVFQHFDVLTSGGLVGQIVFWPRDDFRPKVFDMHGPLGRSLESLHASLAQSIDYSQTSLVLQIYTKATFLRFQYVDARRHPDQLSDDFLDSKRCSPGLYTSLRTDQGREISAKLNLSANAYPGNDLWRRLLEEPWEALILHASEHWENDRDLVVIVVDVIGGSLERIGLVHFNTLKGAQGEPERLIYDSFWETVYLG